MTLSLSLSASNSYRCWYYTVPMSCSKWCRTLLSLLNLFMIFWKWLRHWRGVRVSRKAARDLKIRVDLNRLSSTCDVTWKRRLLSGNPWRGHIWCFRLESIYPRLTLSVRSLLFYDSRLHSRVPHINWMLRDCSLPLPIMNSLNTSNFFITI